ERSDRDELVALFTMVDATVAPCHSIKDIFEDVHYQARGNIASVEDEELGGPIRMQNVIGRFSNSNPRIRHAGPRLGSSNRQVLIDMLGFDETELSAAGYKFD
ncbi:MAG: CoA transferase, partial [Alphaproteobacteria bacterium]